MQEGGPSHCAIIAAFGAPSKPKGAGGGFRRGRVPEWGTPTPCMTHGRGETPRGLRESGERQRDTAEADGAPRPSEMRSQRKREPALAEKPSRVDFAKWRTDQVKTPSPYLSFAFFCERVLIERDGTLTAVRIVDKATVHVPKGDKRAPIATITLAIGVRSGDYKGSGRLQVVGKSPTGETLAGPEMGAAFELLGNDHGHNLILEMVMPVQNEGTYWFDVLFEGRLLTRVPLTVFSSQMTIPTSDHAQDSQSSKQKG